VYLRTTQFIPQVTYSRQLGGLFDKLLDTGSKIYAGQTAKSIAKAQAKTAAAQEALVARQAELEAAKQAGEKLSQTAFDLLHPELSKEEYNKPTVLKATVVKRQQGTTTWNAYTCPSGYRYKKTAQGEHLCFRE
jgi:hypothetical protein